MADHGMFLRAASPATCTAHEVLARHADSWALSWADDICTPELGWGGNTQEYAVFSSSPDELLAHLKSEHCFMGMKSLVIGISCWRWFRKKICKTYGRCCVLFILFLPSFPDIKNSRHSHFNLSSKFWGTSSQRNRHVHTNISFCTQIQGSVNPFMDIYGCALYPRSPSLDGIILKGKGK